MNRFAVPDAAVAVSKDNDVVTAATGIANLVTGARVRPKTLFTAGSITKVFTASLVMTLADESLLRGRADRVMLDSRGGRPSGGWSRRRGGVGGR
ncbi:beta-lactamase family protein [Actinopolyspora sp. BKK1]|nr:beta-lactamase family protein [Actinopolyspora sp. BKK2]NHE75145.1 beta-lactamase family protein [Actinopolyspora sp. BKK1]